MRKLMSPSLTSLHVVLNTSIRIKEVLFVTIVCMYTAIPQFELELYSLKHIILLIIACVRMKPLYPRRTILIDVQNTKSQSKNVKLYSGRLVNLVSIYCFRPHYQYN